MGYVVDLTYHFLYLLAVVAPVIVILTELANLEFWVTQYHRKMFPRCFVR